MNVHELQRDQLIELKQRYLCEHGNPSWGEMADSDELVADQVIFDEYEGVDFTEDDFSCSAMQTIRINSRLLDAVNTILYEMKGNFVKSDDNINQGGFQSDGNMYMPLILLSQEEYAALQDNYWKIE